MGKANEYLHNIPQILRVEEAEKYVGRDVLLFSDKASFTFRSDNLVETNGLGAKWDKKIRDLIRVIKIKNAIDINYEKTNILTLLMFAESASDIPWHLNTQGILFTKVSQKTIEWIKSEIKANRYGKHEFDKFWLPFCKNIDEIKAGDVLCIFNRRVAGWMVRMKDLL